MARIVRFHEYGDASVLEIEKLYVPPPCADEVRIDVKSIGFNRGEVMFRTAAYFQEAQFRSRLGFVLVEAGQRTHVPSRANPTSDPFSHRTPRLARRSSMSDRKFLRYFTRFGEMGESRVTHNS
jgi:hypothetical protein